MNCIINGFHDIHQKEIIDFIINKIQPEKGYLILDDRKFLYQYSNVTILYANELNKGIYPVCNYSFSDDFLKYIHKNFYILSLMMERQDSFKKNVHINYESKKNDIYKHFAYWYNEIKNAKIDFFISSNIPHDIYDYIIFLTLKYFGKTKFLFFYQSNFMDVIIPLIDGNYLYPSIEEEFNKQLLNKNFVFKSKVCVNEYNRQTNNVKPFYMSSKKKNLLIEFCKVTKKIIDKGLIYSYKSYKRNSLYKAETKKLRDAYEKKSMKPNFTENYFYFPLHYQPELTSCPLGGDYIDQYLIIDLISSLLPDNFYLYVKEHPKQEIANRYGNYYSDTLIRNKNNIKFIKTEQDSYELINHSKGVITITGTAGWESLFRCKPVIVFGKNFYNYAPNVFYVENYEMCKSAINTIIKSTLDFSEISLKKFMVAVNNVCIEGFIDPVYEDSSIFTYKQSNNNIINFIKKFLEKGI